MANRNYNRKQALEKEVKELYAEVSIGAGAASTAPDLGDAEGFAILGASTVTNTGGTVIIGDLGLSPGTSVTGFPPGTVSGTQHITDAAAAAAQVSLTAAYINAASRPVTTNYSGTDLGTLTLAPGVYKFNTSAQLTGTLTLDGATNPNGVWIFQIGTTLTTASASTVSLINGALPGNVFWQVGSSATLGTTTAFKGVIMAQASITANTGASVLGSLLARTGAVTLDTNAVTVQAPSAPVAGTATLGRAYGVRSITRLSSGRYQLLLDDKYMRLMQCEVSIQTTLAQDLKAQQVSEDVAGAKTIDFRTLLGAVETDAAADCIMRIFINVKNSSV